MNLSEHEREQADLLFVRLGGGDPALAEKAAEQLRCWGETSPAHRAYLNSLQATENALGNFAEYKRSTSPTTATPLPARPMSRWLIPAMSAAAALLVWIVNPQLSEESYETSIGEQRHLQLSDQSNITLNTNSQISISHRLRSREAHLLQGEVLFDVRHKALRPFHIRTQDAEIRVVGTQFSLRQLPAGSLVTVLQGVVQVVPDHQSGALTLSANQKAETHQGRLLHGAIPVDAAADLSWREGRLLFNATPLSDVLSEIQRYRSAPIQLQDPRLANLQLTGSFAANQPDTLLKILPSLFPLKLTLHGDGRAVISAP